MDERATTSGLLRQWLLDEHQDLIERYRTQIADTVPRDRWREQVDGGGSSIVWLRFHAARHADVALLCALQGRSPLLDRASLGVGLIPAHSGMAEADDRALSQSMDLDGLEAYCTQVDGAVQAWLATADLTMMDKPANLAAVEAAGIGIEIVPWLHRLWSRATVGWLVRWELLGHPLSHVGEMISLRARMGLNPF